MLEAARIAADLRFKIVGSGQLQPLLRDLPPNVEHVAWVEYERLPQELRRAGCALGVFGTSEKAGRVIPNKVFQALACGVPVITADTPAARELLASDESALLVRPGDAQALAAAVRRFAEDPPLARRVADGGELWLRGPELFVGYADPLQTRAAHARGGWFRTGDRATIDDDGWLTVVGRIKDVVIRGGENISVAEVEGVLEAHPAVRQAAVVGYPDDILGERVAAFVVADEGFDLDAVRDWFAEQGVTRFKTPERVVRLDALPTLAAGKPDRTALRELARRA